MHDPITPLGIIDYLYLLLRQFAGGPGPVENNLVRFGIPMILFGSLLLITWNRQRNADLPRERLLIWGFGAGFLREAFMFTHTSIRLIGGGDETSPILALEPIEHVLTMIATVVIAASFIRYITRNAQVAQSYMSVGLVTSLVSYIVVAPTWALMIRNNPQISFHGTWASYVFHIAASVLLLAAISIIRKEKNWLSNTIALALLLFILGEVIILFNFSTSKVYTTWVCPIGNTFHILAIPILGYVYLREQSIEKRLADEELAAYRDHLEELVALRTAELTTTNEQLRQEIHEREIAEAALKRLSQHHGLILNSAGEGIFGVNISGEHTFVNRAAAKMLGYEPEDIIGKPSHPIWHHSYADGTLYPESECPLHSGYKTGLICEGDDQVFWRKDGTNFPVRYISTPIYEEDTLRGAVVIFQDISEEKAAQHEIQRRTTELSVQNTIAETISQSLDLDTILHTAFNTVLNQLTVEAGCIFLLNDLTQELILTISRGKDEVIDHWSQDIWVHSFCADVSQKAVSTMQMAMVTISHDLLCSKTECPARGADHTLVAIPLVAKNRAVGVLTLVAMTQKNHLDENLHLFTAIGQQIGVAIENAQLYQETQRWAAELTQLHEASMRLNTPQELYTLYNEIAQQGMRLLGCDAVIIHFWDAEQQRLSGMAVHGIPEYDDGDVTLSLMDNERQWLRELLKRRQTVVLADTNSPRYMLNQWRAEFNIRAVIGMPLGTSKVPHGYIWFADRHTGRSWRRDEVELAESYVNLASVVIEKALLHQQAERAAALEERQHLAGDVHDGLAQTLSYLGHQIDMLINSAHAGRTDNVVDTGGRIRTIIDQASQEVRHLIAGLQDKPHIRRSIQDLIQRAVTDAKAECTLPIQLRNEVPRPVYLMDDAGEQITRVVQEALRNANKHAQAKQAAVIFEENQNVYTITVSDDGAGFDPVAPLDEGRGHFGLSVMRARAARIHGQLDIESTPGMGTHVILRWSNERELVV